MDDDRRIAALEDVPADSTLLITLRSIGTDPIVGGELREVEAILTRISEEVVCYRNYCPHWLDVALDRGSGASIRNDEIRCQKHGATFEVESGYCNFGPCEGATLHDVSVETRDGTVYLTDGEYEFVRIGGTESAAADSGPRIDFTGS